MSRYENICSQCGVTFYHRSKRAVDCVFCNGYLDVASLIEIEVAQVSLRRMVNLHELMMRQVNHGASTYDADCIREMNEAPSSARWAIGVLDTRFPDGKPAQLLEPNDA